MYFSVGRVACRTKSAMCIGIGYWGKGDRCRLSHQQCLLQRGRKGDGEGGGQSIRGRASWSTDTSVVLIMKERHVRSF